MSLSQHRWEHLKSILLDSGPAASAWRKTSGSHQLGNLGPASLFSQAILVSADLGLRREKRIKNKEFPFDTGLREKRKLDWGNTWFFCLYCLGSKTLFPLTLILTSSKTLTESIFPAKKDNPLDQKYLVSWDRKPWNWC